MRIKTGSVIVIAIIISCILCGCSSHITDTSVIKEVADKQANTSVDKNNNITAAGQPSESGPEATKVPEETTEKTDKVTEVPAAITGAPAGGNVIEEVPGAIRITIDKNKKYQVIDGFGAGFTWYADWMTWNNYAEEAYDLLFKDAGFTILRFKNSYKYKDNFNTNTEQQIYNAASKRILEKGEEVTVLLSSWSPAPYLKQSGRVNGGSSLKKDENGEYVYDELGQYYAELIQKYRENHIPVDYISLQNEPDYQVDYDGCEYSAFDGNDQAQYAKAYLAVYDAIKNMENVPVMMGPETMTVDAPDIEFYMKDIFQTAPESVGGICHHLYDGGDKQNPDSYIMNMITLNSKYKELPKWQTEFYTENAFLSAWFIHNSLVYENVNAYIYWDGVWENPSGLLGFVYDGKQKFVINDRYYAMRHYSEFIRPGYQRIDAKTDGSRDILFSAYISQQGDKIAGVLINKSDTDRIVQFDLPGFEPTQSDTYLSVCQEGYKAEDLYKASGPLPENQSVTIPAMSIMTVVLTGNPAD